MSNLVGTQLGSYTLEKLLGEGGFGSVYLGKHVHLEKYAAIKILLGGFSEKDRETFLIEARTLAKQDHPNIVKLLDYGISPQQFLIMEYASHGKVSKDKLPISVINSYLEQICSGLQHLHNQAIIHRDIKPENILLNKANQALITDLGIAKIFHNSGSRTSVDNTGTAYYMAPEHIQGYARPESDQYSLAVIVYQWLSGRLPFIGVTSVQIFLKHLNEEVPPLGVDRRIESVVRKALSKNSMDRYSSITEFGIAFAKASQVQVSNIPCAPVIIRPPLPSEKQPLTDTVVVSPHNQNKISNVNKQKNNGAFFAWTPRICLVLFVGIVIATLPLTTQSMFEPWMVRWIGGVAFTVSLDSAIGCFVLLLSMWQRPYGRNAIPRLAMKPGWTIKGVITSIWRILGVIASGVGILAGIACILIATSIIILPSTYNQMNALSTTPSELEFFLLVGGLFIRWTGCFNGCKK